MRFAGCSPNAAELLFLPEIAAHASRPDGSTPSPAAVKRRRMGTWRRLTAGERLVVTVVRARAPETETANRAMCARARCRGSRAGTVLRQANVGVSDIARWPHTRRCCCWTRLDRGAWHLHVKTRPRTGRSTVPEAPRTVQSRCRWPDGKCNIYWPSNFYQKKKKKMLDVTTFCCTYAAPLLLPTRTEQADTCSPCT